jgi:preprotein translocase SecE subunit
MAENTTSGPTSVPIPRSKRGLKGFWTEVMREMKKVNWPTRAETNRLTGVVLVVCFIMTLALVGMSYLFQTIIDLITKGAVG